MCVEGLWQVLKSELLRGRQAVDEVLHRQADLQQRVEELRRAVRGEGGA